MRRMMYICYEEDCLHGIVHIQSWTASMEGLCFF